MAYESVSCMRDVGLCLGTRVRVYLAGVGYGLSNGVFLCHGEVMIWINIE